MTDNHAEHTMLTM